VTLTFRYIKHIQTYQTIQPFGISNFEHFIYFDIYPDASMQQQRVRVGMQLDSRSPAWQEKFPETEAFDYGPSLARKLYNLAAKMKIQKHRELWLKATLWQD
jgi:hypothetical protein